MTYDEATEPGTMVTKDEATREYERHGLTVAELIADLGDHAEYEAADVLRWLGY